MMTLMEEIIIEKQKFKSEKLDYMRWAQEVGLTRKEGIRQIAITWAMIEQMDESGPAGAA